MERLKQPSLSPESESEPHWSTIAYQVKYFLSSKKKSFFYPRIENLHNPVNYRLKDRIEANIVHTLVKREVNTSIHAVLKAYIADVPGTREEILIFNIFFVP